MPNTARMRSSEGASRQQSCAANAVLSRELDTALLDKTAELLGFAHNRLDRHPLREAEALSHRGAIPCSSPLRVCARRVLLERALHGEIKCNFIDFY